VPAKLSPQEITEKRPMVAKVTVFSSEELYSPVLILVRLLTAFSVYVVIYVRIE